VKDSTNTSWLRRAAVVAMYDVGDATVVIGRDGRTERFTDDSAFLVRAMVSALVHPQSREALLDVLGELAGGPIEEVGVIDDAIAHLVAAGVVERVPPPSDATPSADAPRPHAPHVVLAITGAIASAYTPMLVGELLDRGYVVRVAATPEALRFVRSEAIEALVHAPVVTAMWSGTRGLVVPHLALAQWADIVVVAPASATTIGRIANGDFSSIVSAVALSTAAPVVVVPSMNPAMLHGDAVRDGLERLVVRGVHVVHPAYGREVAERPELRTPILGASPPPAVIARIVETVLATTPRASTRREPPTARDAWDELYRSVPDDRLPWHAATLDDDLAAHIDRLAPAATDVLDIGTGLGVVATACAARGHRVVAVDVSEVAIARAAARIATSTIVWMVADVAAGGLHGSFALVVDRGCLHVLDADARRRYAAAAVRWCRPGGALLLEVHDAPTAAIHGTWAPSDAQVRALFGDAFVLEAAHDSTMAGPGGSVGARVFVLRRLAD
jgi:3-polyprenyl-4-hydroxybenzoate decarboxylase